MSLQAQLTNSIKTAMKAHDTVALDALRYFLSLIKNVEIDAKKSLTDDEIISLLQKEVKKRREAIDQFKTAGRQELVQQEEQQLAILLPFLPKQLSQEEIEAEMKPLIDALQNKDMSTAMREIMPKFKGRADGKLVSDLVKKLLA